jgi:hypothetical protein
MKADIYQRITDQIICELEKGVRPWLKPWNAEHASGRITRPLRGNGIPYKGIRVVEFHFSKVPKLRIIRCTPRTPSGKAVPPLKLGPSQTRPRA